MDDLDTQSARAVRRDVILGIPLARAVRRDVTLGIPVALAVHRDVVREIHLVLAGRRDVVLGIPLAFHAMDVLRAVPCPLLAPPSLSSPRGRSYVTYWLPFACSLKIAPWLINPPEFGRLPAGNPLTVS